MFAHIATVDTRYGFIIGRLRAMEKRLLDERLLAFVLEAKDQEGVIKLLAEAQVCGCGHLLGHADPPYEDVIEKLFFAEFVQLKEFILSSVPHGNAMRRYFLKYDVANIKYLLRRKLRGLDVEEQMLGPLGNIEEAHLQGFVESFFAEEPEVLSLSVPFEDDLRDVIRSVIEVYKKDSRLECIDYALDRLMFKKRSQTAHRLKQQFPLLSTYFTAQADLYNIRLLLTLRLAEVEPQQLRDGFVPGGTLEERFMQEAMSLPLGRIKDHFMKTKYARLLQESMDSLQRTGSLRFFETEAQNYILEIMRPAKWIGYGPEPIIGYWIAIEYQIDQIRTILLGKTYGFSEEQIREDLAETYV